MFRFFKRLFRRAERYEPFRFAFFRTCVALISLALLLAFGVNLIIQIVDEQFSTRSYTVVEAFNNATKFGMVPMPSILIFTNILGKPSFDSSPYSSIGVFVNCWYPEQASGSVCPCTLSWHQYVVQDTVDQLQWNPAYQCDVCSCPSPQQANSISVNISMSPKYATDLGIYDNTQLILFDPNSQALGNTNSYLNATGEPNERAYLTPFSLYTNLNNLFRYRVDYSRYRKLKRSARDIIGLPGTYQSVNLYTIDSNPESGMPGTQYNMTAVFYPGWGISLGGSGFVVTEEFRTHTVLTLLASLGGLWTVLNDVFLWLFGRSLLFPILGKKPITPFGLMGRFFLGKVMSSERRERIQERIDEMGPNQIVRDFVIDMSPFIAPPDKPNHQDLEKAQMTPTGEFNPDGLYFNSI